MKMKPKILSLIITLAIVFALVAPMSVSAVSATTNVTEELSWPALDEVLEMGLEVTDGFDYDYYGPDYHLRTLEGLQAMMMPVPISGGVSRTPLEQNWYTRTAGQSLPTPIVRTSEGISYQYVATARVDESIGLRGDVNITVGGTTVARGITNMDTRLIRPLSIANVSTANTLIVNVTPFSFYTLDRVVIAAIAVIEDGETGTRNAVQDVQTFMSTPVTYTIPDFSEFVSEGDRVEVEIIVFADFTYIPRSVDYTINLTTGVVTDNNNNTVAVPTSFGPLAAPSTTTPITLHNNAFLLNMSANNGHLRDKTVLITGDTRANSLNVNTARRIFVYCSGRNQSAREDNKIHLILEDATIFVSPYLDSNGDFSALSDNDYETFVLNPLPNRQSGGVSLFDIGNRNDNAHYRWTRATPSVTQTVTERSPISLNDVDAYVTLRGYNRMVFAQGVMGAGGREAGVAVDATASLIITDRSTFYNGELFARGGGSSPAIGGGVGVSHYGNPGAAIGRGGSAGFVQIDGGTVTAFAGTGSHAFAGIGNGSSFYHADPGSRGMIINGGTVEAFGFHYGIGSNGGHLMTGNVSSDIGPMYIVITGGNVTSEASASSAGAAIGFAQNNDVHQVRIGRPDFDDDQTEVFSVNWGFGAAISGDMTFYSGVIAAYSGEFAAAIGGSAASFAGNWAVRYLPTGGRGSIEGAPLTAFGGNVTAKSGAFEHQVFGRTSAEVLPHWDVALTHVNQARGYAADRENARAVLRYGSGAFPLTSDSFGAGIGGAVGRAGGISNHIFAGDFSVTSSTHGAGIGGGGGAVVVNTTFISHPGAPNNVAQGGGPGWNVNPIVVQVQPATFESGPGGNIWFGTLRNQADDPTGVSHLMNFEVQGGQYGAGIGGGGSVGGAGGAGGAITISGGTVTASSANAEAVGRGGGSGTPSSGTLNINGTFNYRRNATNTDPGGAGTNHTFTGATTHFAGNRFVRLEHAPITSITTAAITVTAPATNVAPSGTAIIVTTSPNFGAGTVSWEPAHNPFQANQAYTATVTITANSNFTFADITAGPNLTINGNNAVIVGTPGATLTISYTFGNTTALTITTAQFTVSDYTHTFSNTPQGATAVFNGTNTAEAGTMTMYYEGTGGTVFAKSTTAPTNAGTYNILVSTTGGTIYAAITDLNVATLTINRATGNFGTVAPIDVTFASRLTLADLTLSADHAWVDDTIELAVGDNQQFAATFNDPSGNFTTANGYITVNVANTPGGEITIPGNGGDTVIDAPPGTIVDGDTITFPDDEGGTITLPDDTMVDAPGGTVIDTDNDTITFPNDEGGTITLPDGEETELPPGTVITIPDGEIEIGGTQRFIVTFNANSGTVTPTSAITNADGTVTLPTPTRSGYNFTNWFTAATGGMVVNASTVFTENTTIFARWTRQGGGGGGWWTPITPPTPEDTTNDEPNDENEYLPTDEVPPNDEDGFVDVNLDDWFYNYVRDTVENNLMNGISATEFAPNAPTTRAMFVTVLWRLTGSPTTSGTPFTDVASGTWYADAVTFKAANDIVLGFGDGIFAPHVEITREQMAAILWRHAGEPNVDSVALPFSDTADISAWAVNAVSWAVENEILRGNPDGTFNPQGLATRAEIAAVLARFVDMI